MVVGITDYAQDQLGDVVYVELPKVGDRVVQSQIFGVIESVKTASDLFRRSAALVIALNGAMADDPAQVNDSPYEDGWLIKVKTGRRRHTFSGSWAHCWTPRLTPRRSAEPTLPSLPRSRGLAQRSEGRTWHSYR